MGVLERGDEVEGHDRLLGEGEPPGFEVQARGGECDRCGWCGLAGAGGEGASARGGGDADVEGGRGYAVSAQELRGRGAVGEERSVVGSGGQRVRPRCEGHRLRAGTGPRRRLVCGDGDPGAGGGVEGAEVLARGEAGSAGGDAGDEVGDGAVLGEFDPRQVQDARGEDGAALGESRVHGPGEQVVIGRPEQGVGLDLVLQILQGGIEFHVPVAGSGGDGGERHRCPPYPQSP